MYFGYFLWRKIMAISKYTADREKQKFKESTAVPGQVAVVVTNPDGTSVGGGAYNATPPTYTDGDTVQAQYDVNGNQKVTLATKLAGEDLVADVIKVEQANFYTHISTATTTTIKSGAGFLHSVVITGGTLGAWRAYDNTSGSSTLIASFDGTPAVGVYTFNTRFNVGLTIVTDTAIKLTVMSRV